MNYSRSNFRVIVGAIALSWSVPVTSAQTGVVNVDFNSAGSPTYFGQGAFADPGHNFFNGVTLGSAGLPPSSITTPFGPLLESDGSTVSSVSGSLTYFRSFSVAGGPNPTGNALLDDYGYIQTNAGITTGSFSIAGLISGGTYNLYLYGTAGRNAPQGTTFTVGGFSQSTTGLSAATPLFTLNADYVAFLSVTASGAGGISGTFTSNVDPDLFGPFNGFQLVAIPEASSYGGLLGVLGLVAAIRLRQTRKTST